MNYKFPKKILYNLLNNIKLPINIIERILNILNNSTKKIFNKIKIIY